MSGLKQISSFSPYSLRSSVPWAVFISGSGSTLEALLEEGPQINIKLVVSNKKHARGLLRAKRFGIKTLVLPQKIDWNSLNQQLIKLGIVQIALCGFMKIVPESFIRHWSGRLFNIHPSLLPLHKGLHAAEKSWEQKSSMGVTIHHVTAGVDEGQIVFQMSSLLRKAVSKFSQKECLLFNRSREPYLLRRLVYRSPNLFSDLTIENGVSK